MHCNSVLLWDRLTSISGNVSKLKGTHTHILNESTVTFVQQTRTFNSVPNEVPVQLHNLLMLHPPLSHLASTQNDFYCSNGLNQELEMNPTGEEQVRGSGCVSAVDAVNRSSPARDLSLDNMPMTIERCWFQRKSIFLPPDIAFQVHLASVLKQHQGNDLNMFKEITECISTHAIIMVSSSKTCTCCRGTHW